MTPRWPPIPRSPPPPPLLPRCWTTRSTSRRSPPSTGWRPSRPPPDPTRVSRTADGSPRGGAAAAAIPKDARPAGTPLRTPAGGPGLPRRGKGTPSPVPSTPERRGGSPPQEDTGEEEGGIEAKEEAEGEEETKTMLCRPTTVWRQRRPRRREAIRSGRRRGRWGPSRRASGLHLAGPASRDP